MASTLLPYAAFDYAKQFISNMDLERMLPRILDDTHKMFWMYAPWRWTVGVMAPVTITPNTQDYVITPPADFLYLQDVLQLDGKSTRHIRPSAIYASTPSLRQGQINNVAVMTSGSNTIMRVDPTPGDIPVGAPIQQLIGIYKKVSPTIDSTTMYTAGALSIPDEFFWVFLEGVVWKAMHWAEDARAGEVKFAGGQVTYSGQRAAFEAAMAACAEKEKLNRPDQQEDAR